MSVYVPPDGTGEPLVFFKVRDFNYAELVGTLRKRHLEEALVLDLPDLMRKRYMVLFGQRHGILRWADSRTGQELGAATYEVDTAWSKSPYFRIGYVVGGVEKSLEISLVPTKATRGTPRRWWFQCPVALCHRRTSRLYLPAGRKLFACRRCVRLHFRDEHLDLRVPEAQPLRITLPAESLPA
jgi:hypothetical protein